MAMFQGRHGSRRDFAVESLESRIVLSSSAVRAILYSTRGTALVRPNTPTIPYGFPTANVSFVDPSVGISNGHHIVVGQRDFIAPFVKLNATSGYIKVGNLSAILDNATITANPTGKGSLGVVIGQSVLIGQGATIIGPAVIGTLSNATRPTAIGPGALIDGATIQQGAFIGALARVGPGITVPTGMRVLPGVNITTQDQATNPSLGYVVPATASDASTTGTAILNAAALAPGYVNVYQGSSATGTAPALDAATLPPQPFNGNLALVLGSGPEPGTTVVSYEPARQSPTYGVGTGTTFHGQFHRAPFRATGQVLFGQTANEISVAIGKRNSFRGDQGQPIRIGSIAKAGSSNVIGSPVGGQLSIGTGLVLGDNVVLQGGTSGTATIGNNVAIGSGSVVANSNLGAGVVVGSRSYVANSTIEAGTVVPDGAIIINNVRVGTIQW